MFEAFIKKQIEHNKTIYYLVSGVFFTLVSFITSYLLFKPFIGLSTILFTVILTLPTIGYLTKKQVGIKNKNFYQKYKSFIDFYLYFFIGVFLVLFVIAIIAPDMVFSLQDLSGKAVTNIPRMFPTIEPPKMQQVNSVFSNNIFVMIIALILSLFYGSGALFLITFNASIFASALAEVIKMKVPHKGILFLYAFVSCNMGTMFIHMIPEVLGYFIAAISGGLLSTAVVNEKFMSPSFKKIIKESGILLAAAAVILYISALLEVFVSKELNLSNICANTWNMINIGLIIIIIAILGFEFIRRKRKKRTIKHKNIFTEKFF